MIEAVVGECDKRLMAATVMPPKRVRPDSRYALAFVKHTVEVRRCLVLRGILFIVIAIVIEALEEVSRWKLLAVAGHDELTATVDGSDSILRKNLRRLVKDHQIEREFLWRQKLAD